MKIKSALKKYCQHCYIVKRGKKVMIKCKIDPRHKQRQGFCTAQEMQVEQQQIIQNECLNQNMVNMDQIYIMSKIQNDCMMTYSISDLYNKIIQ
ncbi:hypothetical protein ABPG74_006119 [Tetrahymena malaccensis]